MNDILMTAHKAWAAAITALTAMLSLPSIDGHASPFATLTSAAINAAFGVPGPAAIDCANATNAIVTAILSAAATGAVAYWVPNQQKLTPAQLGQLAATPSPSPTT